MVALSRNVANKHAMEMLLTGDMTPAARAAEIGLVNRVVSPEDISTATAAMARKIASKSSMTLAIGKRAFYEQRELQLAAAYDHASAVMVENMLARDAEEGIGAFIAKRADMAGQLGPARMISHLTQYNDFELGDVSTDAEAQDRTGTISGDSRWKSMILSLWDQAQPDRYSRAV